MPLSLPLRTLIFRIAVALGLVAQAAIVRSTIRAARASRRGAGQARAGDP